RAHCGWGGDGAAAGLLGRVPPGGGAGGRADRAGAAHRAGHRPHRGPRHVPAGPPERLLRLRCAVPGGDHRPAAGHGAPAAGHAAGHTGAAAAGRADRNHTSRRVGDGTAFRDVHLFTPGDRLRRIDWRVSARRSLDVRTGRLTELYVRRTFATADASVMLVVDSRDAVGPDVATWGGGQAA